MEFLMTYGWAILVVLAAIGALAYFGILSPGKILPNSFTMSGGISSGQYKLDTNGTLILGFTNNIGERIEVMGVEVNSSGGSGVTCNAENKTVSDGLLDNSEAVTYHFDCGEAAGVDEGEKFKGDVRVYWKKTIEEVTHTASGSLSIAAEE